MLILSRREAERICLGDDIVLTIVAVGNDKVRIGVQAPSGIRILRNELEREKATVPFPVPPLESETAQQTEQTDLTSSTRKPGPLAARPLATRGKTANRDEQPQEVVRKAA